MRFGTVGVEGDPVPELVGFLTAFWEEAVDDPHHPGVGLDRRPTTDS